MAEALALEAPQRPPQLRLLVADDVRAEVAVRPAAVALLAELARAGSRTMATGRQWYSRASATSGLRASGWTLVASTTVSRPAASRLRGDEVQHVEGVVRHRLVVLVVADTSPGRRPTTGPRSAGSACARTCSCPTRWGRSGRRGRVGNGDRSCRPREHRHLRRRPDLGVLRPDRQEPHGVAEPGGDAVRPRPGTRRGSTRSGGRGGGTARRAASPTSRCTRGSASSATTVAGRANSNRTRSNAASRGGSRCSMTSTTAAASKPSSRLSRYISEPWIRRIRSRCFGGSRSSLRRSAARFERPVRDVHADDLVELLVLQQPPQQLALAAAEVEHPRCAAPPAAPRTPPRALLVQADRPLDDASCSSFWAAAASSSGCSSAVSRARASRTASLMHEVARAISSLSGWRRASLPRGAAASPPRRRRPSSASRRRGPG